MGETEKRAQTQGIKEYKANGKGVQQQTRGEPSTRYLANSTSSDKRGTRDK
jgi:hypothetical protein